MGAKALIHGNPKRQPWNAIPTPVKEQVIQLAGNQSREYNFSHFADPLAEDHQIRIRDEALRRWRRPRGWGKSPRRLKKHRRRRKRREREGELLFLDGSPPPWFGETGPEACLILCSDDATGKPLSGKFPPNEDRNGCFEVCAKVFAKSGLPLEFYQDRASQFQTTRPGGLHVRQGPEVEDTHFQRALALLQVGIIFAYRPQARGCGERLHGSFPGRLVAELQPHGIKDGKSSPKYLNQVLLPKYQKRFAPPPANPDAAWRPLPKELNLQTILCAKEDRMIANDNSVSFNGQPYQLTPPPGRFHLLPARVQVQQHFDGSIHFLHPKLGELKAKKIPADQRRTKVA